MAGWAAAMRHGYHGKRRRATAVCTRQIGAEGIVSKRAGSAYRSDGAGRDWLRTKVSETAAFVITG
jgi:ATP-dependent DNA ligase